MRAPPKSLPLPTVRCKYATRCPALICVECYLATSHGTEAASKNNLIVVPVLVEVFPAGQNVPLLKIRKKSNTPNLQHVFKKTSQHFCFNPSLQDQYILHIIIALYIQFKERKQEKNGGLMISTKEACH